MEFVARIFALLLLAAPIGVVADELIKLHAHEQWIYDREHARLLLPFKGTLDGVKVLTNGAELVVGPPKASGSAGSLPDLPSIPLANTLLQQSPKTAGAGGGSGGGVSPAQVESTAPHAQSQGATSPPQPAVPQAVAAPHPAAAVPAQASSQPAQCQPCPAAQCPACPAVATVSTVSSQCASQRADAPDPTTASWYDVVFHAFKAEAGEDHVHLYKLLMNWQQHEADYATRQQITQKSMVLEKHISLLQQEGKATSPQPERKIGLRLNAEHQPAFVPAASHAKAHTPQGTKVAWLQETMIRKSSAATRTHAHTHRSGRGTAVASGEQTYATITQNEAIAADEQRAQAEAVAAAARQKAQQLAQASAAAQKAQADAAAAVAAQSAAAAAAAQQAAAEAAAAAVAQAAQAKAAAAALQQKAAAAAAAQKAQAEATAALMARQAAAEAAAENAKAEAIANAAKQKAAVAAKAQRAILYKKLLKLHGKGKEAWVKEAVEGALSLEDAKRRYNIILLEAQARAVQKFAGAAASSLSTPVSNDYLRKLSFTGSLIGEEAVEGGAGSLNAGEAEAFAAAAAKNAEQKAAAAADALAAKNAAETAAATQTAAANEATRKAQAEAAKAAAAHEAEAQAEAFAAGQKAVAASAQQKASAVAAAAQAAQKTAKDATTQKAQAESSAAASEGFWHISLPQVQEETEAGTISLAPDPDRMVTALLGGGRWAAILPLRPGAAASARPKAGPWREVQESAKLEALPAGGVVPAPTSGKTWRPSKRRLVALRRQAHTRSVAKATASKAVTASSPPAQPVAAAVASPPVQPVAAAVAPPPPQPAVAAAAPQPPQPVSAAAAPAPSQPVAAALPTSPVQPVVAAASPPPVQQVAAAVASPLAQPAVAAAASQPAQPVVAAAAPPLAQPVAAAAAAPPTQPVVAAAASPLAAVLQPALTAATPAAPAVAAPADGSDPASAVDSLISSVAASHS